MKQIFIDLTSKNCMFNSIESQGSFLFHRFGKRDIQEEHLDISKLIAYLDNESPNQIILESVFGDPLEYKHIKELFNYCRGRNIQIVCVTNGFSDNFADLDVYDVYYIFKIYSFTETSYIFYPNNSFEKLLTNLKYCDKIQYNVYRENLKDIDNVYEYSDKVDIEFVKGPLVHLNINHVCTEEGKWLYDVFGLNDFDIKEINYETLSKLPKDFTPNQTMEGYHLLKNYVKPPVGSSILDTNIYKVDYDNNFNIQTSISYKGHIFNSVQDRNIVTNTYITDWTLDSFKTDDQYQKSIVSILSNFVREKQSI